MKLISFATTALVVAVAAWWMWSDTPPSSLRISSEINDAAEPDHALFDYPKLRINYPKVSFSTVSVTKQSYRKFLQNIRDVLQHDGGGGEIHGIPRLRDPGTVPDSERFLLVELSNNVEDYVTVAIDITNIYVVGYRAREATESYFFEETYNYPARPNLFPGTNHTQLRFSSNYGALHNQALQNRRDVWLGIPNLNAAITRLVASTWGTPREQARGLIVIIQMVSEAVRFRYIEMRVVISIFNDAPFQPDETMISLENNFDSLSSAVQSSNPDNGVFETPVEITRRDLSSLMIDRSVTVVGELLIMLFACGLRHSSTSSPSQLRQEEMCLEAEPTVRIVGQNNLCIEGSTEGDYQHSKDAVLLRPCKEPANQLQLWTFKLDQTLRSGGKCMTVSRYTAGSYIMIRDCPSQATDAMRWFIGDDGTISLFTPLAQQTLILSTPLGDADTELIIDTLGYHGPGQAWTATNNTEAFYTFIVSLRDDSLCATVDPRELVLYLRECGDEIDGQMLGHYADGTLRLQRESSQCLTCDISLQPQSSDYVYLDPCSGIPGQRWVFEIDGIIRNLRTRYALDVPEPEFSKKIIITPPGQGNQIKWYTPLH